ncbi:MAG TPA: hypothetical protein VMW38_01855 [Terriglobia bacterium]|nr:hypothetical protein [Terriglobia bacterium]
MDDALPPPLVKSAAVFIAGLVLRIWLIHAFPIVFGGDSVLRLANRDHILLSYQLPLLQVLIYGVSLISQSLLVIRCLMAIIGATAGIGFYWLIRSFVSERTAFIAALLFTANPFLVEISIVPYQELLMLAGLLFAFQYFLREQQVATSISLAVACLARFEAWIAVPLFAVARARNVAALARACLLFGWAPLAWVLFHVGLSGPGTFVIEWPTSLGRLMRWVYLGWITVKNTPAPALALALAGFWHVCRKHLLRDARVRLLAGFLGLFLMAILFSSHGVSPNPERFVASREATILIAATLGLAALGLEELVGSPHPWLASMLVVLGLTWSVVDVHRFLRRDTGDPHLQLSYQLAQYLDRSAGKEEKILILVKPLPEDMIQEYLDRVRLRQGEAGVARAKQIMAGMDISPPDCQRTIIHSRIGKPRMSCSGDPADKEWIAVWSDSGSIISTEPRVLRTTLRSGPLSVQVYR